MKSAPATNIKDLLRQTTASKIDQQLARRSLLEFTKYTFDGNYDVNWHHKLICDKVDEWIDPDSDLDRLIVEMPPRHGKSEIVSRRTPSYIFGKYPDSQVMSLTYGETLSNDMNRDVQRIMDSGDYGDVFPRTMLADRSPSRRDGGERRNMSQFEIVGHKGRYISSGIMGGVTGKGADYIIIDDPIKNMEEALSPAVREKVFREYTASLMTRLESDAKVLITMTRWHNEDLVGQLLEIADEDPDADQWERIRLPAICDDPDRPYEQRAVGEALWAAKKDIKALERIKATVPSLVWSALFQQTPTPDEGEFWKHDYIRKVAREDIPKNLKKVATYWDTAYTEDDSNSANAWVTAGVHNKTMYIVDCGARHVEFPKLIKLMEKLRAPHKVEAKASGKSAKQTLTDQGVKARELEIKGDKLTRTNDITPHGHAGRIAIAADLYDYLMEDTKQGIIYLSDKNPDIDLNDALTLAGKDLLGGALTDWKKFADDPDLTKGRQTL